MRRALSPRLLLVLAWLAALGLLLFYCRQRGYGLAELLQLVHAFMNGDARAPFIYIGVYLLRPLLLFPPMWLTLLGGSLFGFWPAVIYTVIGQNLSAHLAWLLGRLLGGRSTDYHRLGFLHRWRDTLEEQAFSSVLILRVIYSPYDLVNYGCGLLGVPWRAYALATLLGTLPSLLTFASFGASLEFAELVRQLGDFSPARLFDTRQLLISATLLAFSLVVAHVVHRRHAREARRRAASRS